MNNDHTAFPVQKLALRDKTQKWKETCVDAIVAREDSAFYGRDNRKSEMLTNYGLYNSEYDENDLKYVTDPFKVDDGFPARTQDFNIIRSKIDLLIGEESKRPSTTKVVQTNPEVVTQLQEKKKQLLLQYLNLFISGCKEQQTDENGQPMTPPEIEEYMRKKYRTVAEDTARHALTYYKEQLNIKNEFLKGFKDALIGAEEIYYVGVRNGNPFAERVNPVCFDYDKDPDLEFIEDGDWCLRRMDMSPAMIYDRFYDKLTPSDLDKILEYANDRSDLTNAGQGTINSTSIMYKERFSNKFFNGDWSGSDGDTIAVYHCCWRSYKKVGFLTLTDPETGEVSEVMVDESYKKQEGDILKWDWLPEIWEGYRCGDENAIYFGIGPVEYQHVSVNDPSNRKLPYVGAIYSNTNSTPKSLVKIMKPYQYMYIILWYRLEVALARDKGKVLNMDITQIPKGLGISVEQWMHYLSAVGVNFINPYDEGFNIPGREGGRAGQFNQITSVDLTMSNVIAEYINLMAKIEELVGEICGVTKQRQGAIQTNELVGNVERSVIQSSHTTEPLFWLHNQVKKNVYTMLIDVAKYCARNTDRPIIHFIQKDGDRIFLELNDDFLYSDYGVFIGDSSKEETDINSLKSLLQYSLGAGGSLNEAAEIIVSDNVSEIKEKLAVIEARKQQMEQQQLEIQQQQVQQLQEAAQLEAQLKQEELRIKEEDSIRKAETDIQVATINAAARQYNGQNADGDGILDQVETELAIKKAQQEQIKLSAEIDAKKKELEIKQNELELKQQALEEQKRKDKKAEEQKNEELAIRRKQASRPVSTNK